MFFFKIYISELLQGIFDTGSKNRSSIHQNLILSILSWQKFHISKPFVTHFFWDYGYNWLDYWSSMYRTHLVSSFFKWKSCHMVSPQVYEICLSIVSNLPWLSNQGIFTCSQATSPLDSCGSSSFISHTEMSLAWSLLGSDVSKLK